MKKNERKKERKKEIDEVKRKRINDEVKMVGVKEKKESMKWDKK